MLTVTVPSPGEYPRWQTKPCPSKESLEALHASRDSHPVSEPSALNGLYEYVRKMPLNSLPRARKTPGIAEGPELLAEEVPGGFPNRRMTAMMHPTSGARCSDEPGLVKSRSHLLRPLEEGEPRQPTFEPRKVPPVVEYQVPRDEHQRCDASTAMAVMAASAATLIAS